jgi:hypothetical protein
MKTPSLRCSLVVLLSALFAGPAFAEVARDRGAAPVVAVNEQAPVAAAPLTDRERFSQREEKAPGLQKFKGGDDGPEIYVGIGGGTLAVILIVVIIILLVH